MVNDEWDPGHGPRILMKNTRAIKPTIIGTRAAQASIGSTLMFLLSKRHHLLSGGSGCRSSTSEVSASTALSYQRWYTTYYYER